MKGAAALSSLGPDLACALFVGDALDHLDHGDDVMVPEAILDAARRRRSIRSTVARKENSPDYKSGPRLNGGSSDGLYGTARFQEYFVRWVIWFREEEEPRWQLAHGLAEHQSGATQWQRHWPKRGVSCHRAGRVRRAAY
jgi:hypothetical protein